MNEKKIYSGINDYKLLAAFLVIAIHTSPLATFSPEADFILTRILARTAVPFFFMVTGYFVLPRALDNPAAALRYLKKIGILYLASMVLYLPVGIYAGHFKDATFLSIPKMILLDGTFYHLWYLPALLLGFVLLLFFLKNLPVAAVCVLTVILYLMGLFGDSYYGLISNPSLIHTCYEGIFHVFEYTRNGLFYAPAFLLLGWLLSSRERPSLAVSLGSLGVCFALLLAEGITLHLLEVQRHDSMYLSLLPLMYFLFSILLDTDPPDLTRPLPKELPLLLYLLHPLFIILVRGAAKAVKLPIFIDNSLLHFLAVAASTFLCSWLLLLFKQRLLERIYGKKRLPVKKSSKTEEEFYYDDQDQPGRHDFPSDSGETSLERNQL